jgi:1-acyl-sn-glycerol-3-phosphate acyltransferase
MPATVTLQNALPDGPYAISTLGRRAAWPRHAFRLLWPRVRFVLILTATFGMIPLMGPLYYLIWRPIGRMYWWGLKYIAYLRFLTGAKPITRIAPEVDLAKPYVYVSNHLSYLDIAVVMTTIPIWWRFIAMKSLRLVPVFGAVMNDLGNLFIDRGTTERAYASIEAAAGRVATGQSFLVYPEGGISRDGSIQHFKRGAFDLAIRAGVPVVPVVMRGTKEVLDIHRAWSRPGVVTCDILPPIASDGETDPKEFAERVRQVMIEAKARLEAAKPLH